MKYTQQTDFFKDQKRTRMVNQISTIKCFSAEPKHEHHTKVNVDIIIIQMFPSRCFWCGDHMPYRRKSCLSTWMKPPVLSFTSLSKRASTVCQILLYKHNVCSKGSIFVVRRHHNDTISCIYKRCGSGRFSLCNIRHTQAFLAWAEILDCLSAKIP